ncbi:hypothetical protein AURDEDRAFT_111181 [Auricularia subglabra TFB-10046 SS5]|nr:hypothetical protein AURDEDRAFT_111181 [Auricularia subglabra TFB-10046 SS5]
MNPSLRTTLRWYARVPSARAASSQVSLPLRRPCRPSPPPSPPHPGFPHLLPLQLAQIKRVKGSSLTPLSSPAAPPARKRKALPQSDESSEDDLPLSQQQSNGNGHARPGTKQESNDDLPFTTTARKSRASAGRRSLKEESDAEDDNDSDEYESEDAKPAAKKGKAKAKPKAAAKAKAPPKKRVKKEEDDEDAMDLDETPKPKKAAAPRKSRAKKADDDEDKPKKAPRKSKAAAVKDEETEASVPPSPTKKGRGKKAKKEEDEEEVFKWWELEALGDGTQKWKTLDHNGVLFPPPYQPLPADVKMLYDGKPVDLPPESEEVALFFGQLLGSDHANDTTFQKNFFKDFTHVLKVHPPRDGTRITSFNKCDFRQMFEFHDAERIRKKNMSGEEKKAAKEAKDKLEAPYTHCMLDGRKEKIGNFRIEPPGLFRGRGEHPKKGCLKTRVYPEDITINIGEGVKVPEPSIPGKWHKVIHDNTVTWLATWKENVNGNTKYVFLSAGSSLKGQSDMNKFEKARELAKYVDTIREDYERDLKSKVMADRQRATAMYFIDRLALRAGNEKGEDEADTVGCCSLRCEHVTLERDTTDGKEYVVFDFLGKDSIRYYNRVEVTQQVFKNIRIFKGDSKTDEDALFDRVTTSSLNKHLQSYMKGLTAKVFRTYNASVTMQRLLDAQDLGNATIAEKIAAYTDANREVAILCNHQRAAPKTHDATMEKLGEKLKAMKYERMKLRHALFTAEPKKKKERKDLTELESDIDDDWIEKHEDEQRRITLEKAEKKFMKDNEKLAAEGKEEHPDSVLKDKRKAINEEFDRLKKERGTGKSVPKGNKSADALENAIEKMDAKIKAFRITMNVRDTTKTVALGTSKINYLDPRITVAWCKKNDVPVERMFNKSLLVKFPWAMGADADWKF